MKVPVLARTRATVCDWTQGPVEHLALTSPELSSGPVVLHSPSFPQIYYFLPVLFLNSLSTLPLLLGMFIYGHSYS